jgi:hypothetical protein
LLGKRKIHKNTGVSDHAEQEEQAAVEKAKAAAQGYFFALESCSKKIDNI